MQKNKLNMYLFYILQKLFHSKTKDHETIPATATLFNIALNVLASAVSPERERYA